MTTINQVRKTAKMISLREPDTVWFVLDHPKCQPVAVISHDLKRYMRVGYVVVCCYCAGNCHNNAFYDRAKMRWEFTEALA